MASAEQEQLNMLFQVQKQILMKLLDLEREIQEIKATVKDSNAMLDEDLRQPGMMDC